VTRGGPTQRLGKGNANKKSIITKVGGQTLKGWGGRDTAKEPQDKEKPASAEQKGNLTRVTLTITEGCADGREEGGEGGEGVPHSWSDGGGHKS